MEAVLFEVMWKAGAFLAAIIALICWFNAGCPFYTITRKHN